LNLFIRRIGFQVVSAAAGLAIGVLTARWLGPEGKGMLAIAQLVPFVGATLAALGLYETVSFLSHRRGIGLSRFVGAVPLHLLMIGLPAAIVAGAFLLTSGAGLWETGFGWTDSLLVAALLLARLAVMILRGVLRADERFDTVIVVDALDILLPLLLMFMVWSAAPLDLTLALAAILAGALAVLVVCIVASRRYRQRRLGLAAWKSHIKAIVPVGITTQLRFVGVMIIQRANFLVVSAMLGMDQLGLYAVATAMAEALIRIPDAATWIVTPKAAKVDEREAHRLTMKYSRWVLALVVVCVAGVWLAAEPVMLLLFDTDFAGATPALRTMLVGVAALSFGRVLESSLIGRGRVGAIAAASWAGGAVILLLDALLIPAQGLAGAGWATSGGYLVTAALVSIIYLKDHRSHVEAAQG